MSDISSRLSTCFSAVFPDVPPAEISSASPASIPAWDSVATVTLLTVIEEEFGARVDIDDVGDEISYVRLLAILTSKVS